MKKLYLYNVSVVQLPLSSIFLSKKASNFGCNYVKKNYTWVKNKKCIFLQNKNIVNLLKLPPALPEGGLPELLTTGVVRSSGRSFASIVTSTCVPCPIFMPLGATNALVGMPLWGKAYQYGPSEYNFQTGQELNYRELTNDKKKLIQTTNRNAAYQYKNNVFLTLNKTNLFNVNIFLKRNYVQMGLMACGTPSKGRKESNNGVKNIKINYFFNKQKRTLSITPKTGNIDLKINYNDKSLLDKYTKSS